MSYQNMTGKKFGSLTVTGPHPSKGFWYADCDCGTTGKFYRGTSLRSGNTKSCGCLKLKNPGRKPSPRSKPFISWTHMLDHTMASIHPIREYLKTQGVTVTKDSLLFINGKRFGPFKSPLHAIAEAINRTVRGIED